MSEMSWKEEKGIKVYKEQNINNTKLANIVTGYNIMRII